MANVSLSLDNKSLKVLRYFGRSQHFDTYTEVVKLGLELVAKKYGFKVEPDPVFESKKQSSFKSGLDKLQDSMPYQYELVKKMTEEEVAEYQELRQDREDFSIKDYWVLKDKELL